MTDHLVESDVRSDAELISAVRTGDSHAFGELFGRHRAAANSMASQLVRGPDVDDLVSEAFTKVLVQLQAGAGPDLAFRAYLLTAIRRLHVDRIRAGARVKPTDEIEELDSGVEFSDPAVLGFEHGATAAAFASLPERWQMVLWHLDVEGAKPADIAPMLGMSANSVSALAYRAREGLRQAYLQHHLADTADEQCRWTTDHLGAYVRNGLAKRDRQRVDDHLEGCRRCTGVYLELVEVNSNLGAILGPVLLGSAAGGYLALTAGKAAAVGLPWIGGPARRVKDWAGANGLQAALVAMGSLAVAAAAVGAIYLAATNGTDSTGTTNEAGQGKQSTAPGGSTSPAPDTPAPAPTGSPSTLPSVLPPLAQAPRAGLPVPGLDPGTSPGSNPGTSPGGTSPGGSSQGSPGGQDPTGASGSPRPPGTPGSPGAQPTQSPTQAPTSGPTGGPTDGPTAPPAPPDAPTDLVAVDGDAGVTVTWKAVAGADSYQIYRGAGTGGGARLLPGAAAATTPVATVGGDQTSWLDTGAAYGTTAFYRVRAIGPAGSSVAAATSVLLPAKQQLVTSDDRCWTANTDSPVTFTSCADAPSWKSYDTDTVGDQPADHTIRLRGQCLTHGVVQAEVTTVTLADCRASSDPLQSAQQWTFDRTDTTSAQVIASVDRLEQQLLVLDVSGGVGGRTLILYPHHPPDDQNQRFIFGPVSPPVAN